MMIPLLALTLALPFAQQPAPHDDHGSEDSPSAEELREQIHGMRQTILIGGESVRSSEKQALRFLQEKVEKLDTRMDFIQGDLVQKRTSYELSLNRAGEASTTEAQTAALADAARLKADIQGLEQEQGLLQKRRKSLLAEQTRIDGRRRERESLAAEMDAQGLEPEYVSFSTGGIGLAPEAAKSVNPLMEDPELREDFLRKFPVRGRQLLFDADPTAYWERWPLTPPTKALSLSLAFPLPDLPGRR